MTAVKVNEAPFINDSVSRNNIKEKGYMYMHCYEKKVKLNHFYALFLLSYSML